MAQRHINQDRLSWFSLPREIRDEIYTLILVPGYISVPPPTPTSTTQAIQNLIRYTIKQFHHQPTPQPKPVEQKQISLWEKFTTFFTTCKAIYLSKTHLPLRRQPNLQILATCKRAHEEGLHMFYTRNAFFLPPGPHSHTIDYFHTALGTELGHKIRDIIIILSLSDLDQPIFSRCEVAVKDYLRHEDIRARILSLPNGKLPVAPPYKGQIWAAICGSCLKFIWKQKLEMFRKTQMVMRVQLWTVERAVSIMLPYSTGNGYDGEVETLLDNAERRVRKELTWMINHGGVKAARRCAEKGQDWPRI